VRKKHPSKMSQFRSWVPGAMADSWKKTLTGQLGEKGQSFNPTPQLDENSPEFLQEVSQEMERLKQQSMVQLRRDPKTGKTFYVGAGGVEFPASPEVVQAFTGGAPEPTAPAPVTGASPEPQDYEPGRQY